MARGYDAAIGRSGSGFHPLAQGVAEEAPMDKDEVREGKLSNKEYLI